MEVLCLSLFWYALLCVLSSFAIILKRKRELNVCFYCLTDVWVGLQCVIVVFPDRTHFFIIVSASVENHHYHMTSRLGVK